MIMRNNRFWKAGVLLAGLLGTAAGLHAGAQGAVLEGIAIRETYLYSYQEDPYETYGSGHISTLTPGPDVTETHPALAETLEALQEKMTADFTEEFNNYAEGIREERKDFPSDKEASLTTDLFLRRADDQVLSFLLNYSSYAGGAHGYYSYLGYNFDTETGEEIALGDVVVSLEQLTGVLDSRLKELYPDWSGSSLAEFDYKDGNYPYIWVMEPQGITVYFNPYEIASYADGVMKVDILFDEEPDLFTDRYGKADGAYSCQLTEWPEEYFDLDGDGDAERIAVGGEYDENGTRTKLTVEAGDKSAVREDVYAYDEKPVLMHTADGSFYLYLELLEDNDYRYIEVFSLDAEEPSWVGTVDAGFARSWDSTTDALLDILPVDPECFVLNERMNVLGTYSGSRHCAVMQGGMPEPLDAFYSVASAAPLTTVRELPVQKLDPDTLDPTGEADAVPAGETLIFVRTNGEDLADFKRPDGSFVRVQLDSAGWPRTINGEDEASYFEQLFYAG